MELVFILGFAALWAWVCSNMAAKRNRDTTGWAVGGFLFGIFAVAAIALAGEKKHA